MSDLLTLASMESDDPELVPDILPVDVRLSLTADAKDLAGLLSSAVAVTPVREVIPNTAFTQFVANDVGAGSLHVLATDGFRSVTRVLNNVRVHMSGTALLPGKKILEILRMAEGPVRLDVFSSSATIRAGRALWSVQLPSARQLPQFSQFNPAVAHPVDVREFVRAVSRSSLALAKSSARLSLTQVQIRRGHVLGCDGARVHKSKIESLPAEVNTTAPSSFLDVLLSELKSFEEEEFLFGATDSSVFAILGGDTISAQRLTLEYPDVEHLLLEPAMLNTESLRVPRTDLANAVRRVRINADPDMAAVTLSTKQVRGEWVVLVQARDKTGNSSQEAVSCVFSGETPRDETFNYKYLLDLLGSLTGETVDFRLGEKTKTKVPAVYVEEVGFSGAIMPMSNTF